MQREAIIVMLGFCLTILVASAIVADAGPLDPPGGPVASSMKTLDDVEPRIPLNQSTAPGDADSLFKITEAGSYYLTGNIQGVASKHAIEIAVPSVTLDLAGFTMNGAPSSLDAIHVEPVGLPLLIEIRNGTISGWTEDGIDAEAAIGIRIEDVAVTLCQGFAFRLGDQARLSGCAASFSQIGFFGGESCLLDRCRADLITLGAGFHFENGTDISHCHANGAAGSGFIMGSYSQISDCAATGNDSAGFQIGVQSVITRCLANLNGLVGLSANDSTIIDCRASANQGSGVDVVASTILNTVCDANNDVGIDAGSASIVKSCSAHNNSSHGIEVNDDCIVEGNSSRSNGFNGVGAGIYVAGDDNRIEGNLLHYNDYGLDVDGMRNIIVRNNARGNGANFAQVGGGNILGTVVGSTATMNASENDLINLSF
jgi:parallel beta-helix repeat protein